MPHAPKNTRRWYQFWLSRIVMPLFESFALPSERAFDEEAASRPVLDDEAFYQSYYAASGIAKEIPVRLRRLLAYQLGRRWEKVQPTDQPPEVCPDLDFAEIVFEVDEEFGINTAGEEINALDGSFDSLVRHIARKKSSG